MTPRSKDSVGAVALDLVIDGKSYNAQIKNITRSSQKQLKGMESQFTSSFGRIAKMAAGAFVGIGIGKFVGDCLSLGSALTEVENITAVAFPGMTEQVNDFAKNAAAQFGLSETMAKRFTGMYGTMAKQFGYTNEAAFEMGSTLAGLAGDVASFYDMSQDEAYTKLKAVFSGETEVLKDIGIVMTQAALDQYALANSYGKTTAKMNEQEKVALRYAFVQDQLTAASGDFIRTQDSWANQTRLLSLQFDSLKASLGKGFIALFTPIIKGINWVLSNLQVLADSFANMMEFLTGTSSSSGGGGALAETSGDIASATDSADGLSSGLGDAGKAGEKAAKKINKAFAKVDTINKLTFDSGDSDSDSGSGSGGGSTSGSVADSVDFTKPTEQATVFSKMMDGIIKEFQRLSDIFVKGFELGFGDSFKNIQRIKEYMGSIGDSLKNIFLSAEVTTIAKEWVDNLILFLGKTIGAIASVGVTIGTLVVGSIATYLKDNTNFIRNTIVEWFNLSGRIIGIMGNFYTVVADIFSVFASSQFIEIGSNIIQAVVNGAMNSITLISGVGLSIIKTLCQPIIDNKDSIKIAISEMFAPLVDITDKIASSLTEWESFTQILGLAAGAFVGFKTVTVLLANSGAITALVTGLSSMSGGLAAIGGSIANWGLVSTLKGLALTILPSISAALAALTAPFTLVVLGLTGLAAGFTYLYTTSSQFRDTINTIFSSILSNITAAVAGLINILTVLWNEGFGPVFTSILGAITTLWNGGLSAFIENVSIFLLNVIDGILSIWNNALNPLIELLLTTFLPIFTTVFDTILAIAIPIIEKIMEYANMFMDVLNSLMGLLNEYVLPIFKVVFDGITQAVGAFWSFAEPIFKWFQELLGEVVTFALDYFLMPLDIAFKTIVQIIKDIVDPIKQVFDGVKQTFQGIIDFVTGVFTGNWSKAWEGIKSIFSGMWNSLGGIVDAVWKTITGLFSKGGEIFSGVVDGVADTFKRIVNVIIDGLNKVIAFPFNKINGLLNDIRTIDIPLIGQPFKGLWGNNPLPVPQIPKLAQGGYVKANQPQLAMIGDNRHQGEVVAPEGKMVEMINTALKMQKDNGSVNGIDEVIKLLKLLIETINGLCLKVDIDMKKLSILLEKAKRERDMIGG